MSIFDPIIYILEKLAIKGFRRYRFEKRMTQMEKCCFRSIVIWLPVGIYLLQLIHAFQVSSVGREIHLVFIFTRLTDLVFKPEVE